MRRNPHTHAQPEPERMRGLDAVRVVDLSPDQVSYVHRFSGAVEEVLEMRPQAIPEGYRLT